MRTMLKQKYNKKLGIHKSKEKTCRGHPKCCLSFPQCMLILIFCFIPTKGVDFFSFSLDGLRAYIHTHCDTTNVILALITNE